MCMKEGGGVDILVHASPLYASLEGGCIQYPSESPRLAHTHISIHTQARAHTHRKRERAVIKGNYYTY